MIYVSITKFYFPLRTLRIEPVRLSITIDHYNKIDWFPISLEDGVDWVSEVTVESDISLVRLNYFIQSKKSFERNPLEQDVNLRSMTASVKQLKKKLSIVENDKKLLERTYAELVKKYNAKNTVMRTNLEKLAKSIF